MAEWKSVTLMEAIPDVVETVISSVDEVAGVLQPVMSIAKEGLELSKLLMNGVADPALVAIESLSTTILNEIADIKATGLYQLMIHPYQDGVGSYDEASEQMTLPFPTLLQQVIASFEDAGDLQRPIFTETAECGAVVLILAAPSLAMFTELIASFSSIFADEELNTLQEKIQKILQQQNQDSKESMVPPSVLPDWDSITLVNLFPPVEGMLDEVEGFVQGVKEMSAPASSIIEELIQFIDGKIAQIKEMKEIISEAQALLTKSVSKPGIYGLYIPSESGGVNRIQTEMKKASSAPNPTLPFCAGLVFLGGQSDISFFAELLGVA